MINDFAIFILTLGRPDRVDTIRALQNAGYTGKYFIVIDDEDKTASQYRDKFGDKVLTFSKAQIAQEFDEGDSFKDRRAIIYARNAAFNLARQVGVTYFMQLDDDYNVFKYKFTSSGVFGDYPIKSLDKILEMLLEFYKGTGALSVAVAQGGDFIGGKSGTHGKRIKPIRKAMNTFICSTQRPFQFVGRINEDVNTYTSLARRGGLFMTITDVGIAQRQTQSNAGGMTETYLKSGTYLKSFYSVMYSPSCVRIVEMGAVYRRLHHRVKWNNTCPVIIRESHKKPNLSDTKKEAV